MSTQVTTNPEPIPTSTEMPTDPTKDEKSSTTGTNVGNEVDAVDAEKAAAQDVEAQPTPAAKPGPPGGLPEVPDGGLHAWLTIAGGFFTLFCTFGVIQAFGVFQDYYSRIFINDKTPSEISWIGSLQIFLLFAIGIIAGKIFDNGGFRFLMAFGSLLYVFSVFMLSLAKSHNYYQVILSQGLGEGLGMGLLFLPTLSIISHYFRRRRSLAYGIVVSGTAFGGIVWPIVFNRLFQNPSAGFPWAVRASGFISLALLFVANLIMRTRLPSRKQRPDAPVPDIKGVITDVPYLITLAGGCLVFWGLFFPFFYLELFAIVSGVDPNLAFYSIPILNAGAVFGRTIPGVLADRFGAFNVIIPMTAISGALIFALFGATTKGGVIVFALLYGFFSGAFISLISSLAASFSRNLAEVGVRIGIACFFMSVPLLTGTPISGALIGSLDPANADELTWWKAIVFNAVVVLAGCVVLTIARAKLVVRKGTVWV